VTLAAEEFIPRTARVLLVGCGNSPLTAAMVADGYAHVTSTDYSPTVIARMAPTCPGATWEVQDMRRLTYPAASFDAYLDKAAMDALLADGGDTWSPPEGLLATAASVMAEAARVLVPGGVYLQVSFSQPHFRSLYLRPALTHAAGGALADGFASLERRDVASGFGYFAYAMRKPAATAAP